LNVDVADLKFSKASLPEERAAASNSKTNGALRDVLEETERQQILQALKQCNWVVAGPKGAAKRLGMKQSTLRLRMHKLGISRRSA
jgi:formate hydrogenlyase transcriptional activator